MAKTKDWTKNTVFRRIKYLTLMQIGHGVRDLRTGDKKKLATSIGLKTLFVFIALAAFFVVFFFLKTVFHFDLTRNMLVTILFATQVISIISALSSMMLLLFFSKENNMLLAFPCKYSEIFFSKLTVFALTEIRKSLYFILPLLIGFGANAGVGIFYWLFLPFTWITLCLMPVFIGALLAIPAIYIKRFLETHVWLYSILLIGIIVAAFFGIYSVLGMVPVPIDIGGKYEKFIEGMKVAFVNVNKFALFYNFIGDMMFGVMPYLYFPLTLVCLAGVAFLCFAAAMPFYFRAASATAENSSNKKHISKPSKHSNLFFTFFKKEWKIHFRSFETMTSIITAVFIFPVIAYVFNFLLSVINTSSLGNFMTIAFNLMITLSLLGTHNANTAASISKEGNEFAILKTAPSNTSVIAWAKIAMTAIINFLSLSVTGVMLLITTRLATIDVILMVVTMFCITLGQIAWGFELDIRKPKITDYASKGDAVTDNGNIAKAIALGFLISTLTGLISLILILDAYAYGWVRLVAIAVGFMAIRLYLLRSNLKAYFSDIQG